MNMQFLEEIMKDLGNYLPNDWQHISLYCSKHNTLCETKFFVDSGNGYIDCYNLGIEKYTLYDLFAQISKILLTQRDHLPKKEKWSIIIITINAVGKFNVDFDYSDLSDTFVTKRLEWEKKMSNK